MPAIRLQRFLSQAGVAARRKGEVLITAGRVRVNGRVVSELGTKVDPERDSVEVDGLRVATQKKYYYLLNKPKGYVTTVADPEGRPTVVELLPQLPTAIKPVGRLDFYTEGVLLLTNDGELQDALLSPRSDVKKTYHAKIRGEVPMADVEKLRAGVRITDNEGHSLMTLPAQVDVLRRTGVHTWLVITIREGRSRQIHRMAESLGYQVLKLARVSFADLTYHGLKIGECRPLAMREIHDLRRLAGLSPDVDVAPSPPAGIRRAPAWKTGRGGRSVTKPAALRPRTDTRTAEVEGDAVEHPPLRHGQSDERRGSTRGTRPGARRAERGGPREQSATRGSTTQRGETPRGRGEGRGTRAELSTARGSSAQRRETPRSRDRGPRGEQSATRGSTAQRRETPRSRSEDRGSREEQPATRGSTSHRGERPRGRGPERPQSPERSNRQAPKSSRPTQGERRSGYAEGARADFRPERKGSGNRDRSGSHAPRDTVGKKRPRTPLGSGPPRRRPG